MGTLERHHEPIGATFPRAQAGTFGRHALDADARARFDEQGFVAGVDCLTATDVAALRERLARIGDHLEELAPHLYEVEAAWRARPNEVVLHFLGAWKVDELLHDLVFHPGVTVPVAQLLGVERLRFWHDQVFWKPPRHPGVVPWHQDYSYWTRTGPPAHATAFVALDDVGPENGGLEYVPGSHRWGLLPAQDFGGELDALDRALTDEQRERFRPVPVRLRAGQMAIHHSHLVHGSRGNPSDRPRRAVVLNYFADGTRVVDGGQPLLAGVEPIPAGEPVRGPHFPLVLDRAGEE